MTRAELQTSYDELQVRGKQAAKEYAEHPDWHGKHFKLEALWDCIYETVKLKQRIEDHVG